MNRRNDLPGGMVLLLASIVGIGTGYREKIAEHWTPRLDGKRSIADSLAAPVASFK